MTRFAGMAFGISGRVLFQACAAITIFLSGCGGGGGSTAGGGTPPVITSVSSADPAATVDLAPAFVLGVGSHLFQQDIESNLASIKQMGLLSARDDFQWAGVEREKGVMTVPAELQLYNTRLAQSGISPLMILDYGNPYYDGGGKPVSEDGIQGFANFAKATAVTMGDRVGYFEIWNEWNNGTMPNSAESYLKLVKATAPQVRQGSKALILAGSSNIYDSWTADLVRMGVLDYVDGVSLHPYIQCDGDNRPEHLIAMLTDFAAKLQQANGGREVPLYLTEIGWPTHTGACGVTPEVSARYLARALLLMRTVSSVRGAWWYDLKNDGTNAQDMEANFGLLDYNYQPKPGFNAMADVAQVVQHAKRFTRLPAAAGLVLVEIEDQEGEKSYAIWSDNGKTAEVMATADKGQGQAYRLEVGTGTRIPVPLSSSRSELALSVTGTPQLLLGPARLTLRSVAWH